MYIIYFLIEICEKDMKMSLFYLIHPADSNLHENSGVLTRSPCFMSMFFFYSPILHIFLQAKQSKQLLTKKIRQLSEETQYINFFKEKSRNVVYFI